MPQQLELLPRYVVHCMQAPYDVYIGRGPCPRTGARPGWGNPWRLTSEAERTAVIARYRQWVLNQPELVDRITRELRGKVLGCWCAPKPCHGDVLAELANA